MTTRGPRAGAAVWTLAVQFFVAQAVVQSAWTAPYSLAENYISDLGNTSCGPYAYSAEVSRYVCSPWHAWMNASFVALGLTIVVGAALVRGALPRGGRPRSGSRSSPSRGPGSSRSGCSRRT
jgi:hypothetical protein